jgi:hypothetical protein
MAKTEQPTAARAPLRRASSSFARDALPLLRESMLFAGSVGCILGLALVVLRLF